MDNNTNHTTAAAAGEKKNSVKALLERVSQPASSLRRKLTPR